MERDGVPVPIRAAMLRRLLAVLLCEAGRPVPVSTVMDTLWEAGQPPTARKTLQVYVHRLRQELDREDRISYGPAGYALAVEPHELDVLRFAELAAEARAAASPTGAAGLFHEALGLWRGPAYADIQAGHLVQDEVRRLTEQRLLVHEEGIAVDLSLGRHAQLVPGLRDLAEAHPYREGLRAQLMLALYRSDRQSEALEVFRQTRALLVDQLGVEPGPELRRLNEAILRAEDDLAPPARDSGPVDDDVCPYRGLVSFQPEDSTWFFGRSQLVADLLERIERRSVVAVFGASGSGKSSLLRAGLVAGIDEDRWQTLLLTPTEHPMEALSAEVEKATGRDLEEIGAGVLLVVDQFEEIFTLCADSGERDGFIETLLGMAGRGATVVLGVRADFLAHLTRHPELVAALGDGQLLVGPPSPTDVREIIVRPAVRAGLTVEPDLLATLLADTGGHPGALPLLSHALLETWRSRTGRALTLAGYYETGGVRGAIAKTAERVHAGLDEDGQEELKAIFLRLTALGEGTEDTRRPIDSLELEGLVHSEVLDRLVEARLVVLGDSRVEVAHEALIRAWPRLRRWLSEDREELLAHRRLSAASRTWEELGRDDGVLYRGAQLQASRTLRQPLNQLEQEFVGASREQEERERASAVRRQRVRNRLLVGLAAVSVLAAAGGGVAVQEWQEALRRQTVEQAHQLSMTARSLLATDPDLAGLLAIEGYRMHADTDTEGGVLSTAAAASRRTTLNAGGPGVNGIAFSPDGKLLAAADSEAVVSLWDPRTGARVARLPEHSVHLGKEVKLLYAKRVVFSPDGRLLASLAKEPALGPSFASLVVWDVRTRKPVLQKAFPKAANGMAFSGTAVAVALADGTTQLWDLATGTSRTQPVPGGSSMAFSPGGALLVSVDPADRSPVIWENGRRRATVPAKNVHTVAFDAATGALVTASFREGVRFWTVDHEGVRPRSRLPETSTLAWDVSEPVNDRIAVADENGNVTIWDAQRGTPLETFHDRDRVETLALALSPDGQTLASTGLGRTITVRNRATPPFAGHSGAVNDIETSQDGTLVATAGSDTTVRLWDQYGHPVATLADHPDQVQAIAFSPDGARLAALTRDHTVVLWDVRLRRRIAATTIEGVGASTDIAFRPDGQSITVASTVRMQFAVGPDGKLRAVPFANAAALASALVYHPDGRTLYSTSPSGGLLAWDLAGDREIYRNRQHQGSVQDVAISPDGRLLATAGSDRTAILWDSASGKPLARFAGHSASLEVVAFSRDGLRLATAGADHTIVVWDVRSRQRLATLTGHDARIQGLAFTADGALISGSDDHRVIRWSLAPEAAVAKICDEVARDLTPAEKAAYLPAGRKPGDAGGCPPR
ncbi:BTAD domain-containing putative transcriptional regulator [Nonomuraea sp. NPDC050556]|uniref:nSTAND1 domain-containing NTPase n=1 Tax=Nonomuraea sp. NPDC050556 TaxID=3364369 RepID=UPI0037AF2AA8